MPAGIEKFSINYDPLNANNTFTSGDILQGRVVLEVNKPMKINKLYIKCKGDVNVIFCISSDFSSVCYRVHERYFKLKEIFIWDKSLMEQNGATLVTAGETYHNLVRPGRHAFPFSFQLPEKNTPSSFKGCYGSITYVLEARLSRSWKIPLTIMQEFTFVSNIYGNGAHLMRPLSGAVQKKMEHVTSGGVSFRASTDKEGYRQGESIKVKTHVENSSSSAVKLKFKLEQKQAYIFGSTPEYVTEVIFKAVAEPIPSRSNKRLTTKLKIPDNLDLTITDCKVIKVEYMLKVYVDSPFAKVPEIIFPLVIIPAGQCSIPEQIVNQDTHESTTTVSTFQPGLVDIPQVPVATEFRPDPNGYLSVYTQPRSQEEAPPSYMDIFPNSNPSASVLNPPLSSFSQ